MKTPAGLAWTRHSIQTRAFVLVGIGAVTAVAVLVSAVWSSLGIVRDQLLTERRLLAASIAARLEYEIGTDLQALQGVSSGPGIDLSDADLGPEHAALHEALIRSHLFSAVFLLSAAGDLIASEPSRASDALSLCKDLSCVQEALRTGRPVMSRLVETQAGTRDLFALVPLRDWRGEVVGLVGGHVEPRGPRVRGLFGSVTPENGVSFDLIDRFGDVVGSSDQSRLFRHTGHEGLVRDLNTQHRVAAGTCQSCHQEDVDTGGVREVVAFAPLSVVPWAVSVQQPEREALVKLFALRRTVILLIPVLLATGTIFAYGAARSLLVPLGVLNRAAEGIERGNLTAPIPSLGEDEIGRLGRSLERMRMALKASLDQVAQANQDLERRVQERTRELDSLYRQLQQREEWRGRLLRRVIAAQEAERKRIARELHDDTSQALAALVVRLETAMVSGEASTLSDAKTLAVRTLEELHRLILDLRPSVLDDLGLVSAVRWYADQHLRPAGIAVRCECTDMAGRLPPEVETALFRVVQEALTNIRRHAEAETVLIQCSRHEGLVTIEIEDDGCGFDPATVGNPADSTRGLGLLGMRERVELLGGTIEVDSEPGHGVRVVLTVPVSQEAARA